MSLHDDHPVIARLDTIEEFLHEGEFHYSDQQELIAALRACLAERTWREGPPTELGNYWLEGENLPLTLAEVIIAEPGRTMFWANVLGPQRNRCTSFAVRRHCPINPPLERPTP